MRGRLGFLGVVLCVCVTAQTVTYTYDNAGRLIRADYGGGKTASYTYDPAGNLVKLEQAGGAGFISVSSASFEAGGPLAQESIAAGKGSGLADRAAEATTLPLPEELAGTRVEITDSQGVTRRAPLFYVSPGQINYLVPGGLALGRASVLVVTGSGATVSGSLQIERIAPGIYTANASGSGAAAALWVRAAGEAQTFGYVFDPATRATAPLDLGPESDQVFLLLFGTGIRGYGSQVTASIGGVSVPVPAAVAQGTFQGLDQVNLGPLPRTLAGRGEVEIILLVDGKRANPVKVNIR